MAKPSTSSSLSLQDQDENDSSGDVGVGSSEEGGGSGDIVTTTTSFVPVNFSSSTRKNKPQQKQQHQHHSPLSSKVRSSSFSDSIDREQELVEKQQRQDQKQQKQQHLKTSSSRSNEQSVSYSSSNDMTYISKTTTTTTTTTIISRCIQLPDIKRVERCLRLPEYGPCILFLCGGTAIRDLSTKLKYYTHHSIHLITPFDSGGSSAILRDYFQMLPSVGDLRNRLVALKCDDKTTNSAAITDLLSYRLHKHDNLLAYTEFQQILHGYHPIIHSISLPLRSVLIQHLHWFQNRISNIMSSTSSSDDDSNDDSSKIQNKMMLFNFCGASIGNLIIVGCYVEHGYDIVTAIYWIGTLLGVKGKVRPITAANLHIRSYYNDGTIDIGQHKLGKYNNNTHNTNTQQQDQQRVEGVDDGEGGTNGKKKIIKIDFVESLQEEHNNNNNDDDDIENSSSIECQIDMVSSELITYYADVICFPMGSFFGSIVVNLLPQGVGRAIIQRQCPKVYIPNTGYDPEMYGYTLSECINVIITTIQQDVAVNNNVTSGGGHDDAKNNYSSCDITTTTPSVTDILNIVLVDTKNCDYSIPMDIDNVKQQWPSIDIIDICLVNNENENDINNNSNNDHTPTGSKGDDVDDDHHGIATTDKKMKHQFLDPTKVAEVLVTLGS